MFSAQINLKGQVLCLGSFKDEKAAGAQYAKALYKYRRAKWNALHLQDGNNASDAVVQPFVRLVPGKSKYMSVLPAPNNKWQVYITIDGVKYDLGEYDNEKAAGMAYAKAKLNGNKPPVDKKAKRRTTPAQSRRRPQLR